MKQRTRAGVLIAAMLLCGAAGCSHCPRMPGAAGPAYETTETFVGTFTGPDGKRAEVSRDPGTAGFMLSVTAAAGGPPKTYAMYVRALQPLETPTKFLEIEVGEASGGRTLVFMYGGLEEGPDYPQWFIFRPLRAEWLKSVVAGMQGVQMQEAADAGGAVVLIVSNRAAMTQVLQKAAADPAAFGEPEKWTRANK